MATEEIVEMKEFTEDLGAKSEYLWNVCKVMEGDLNFWMRGTMNDKIFSRNLVCGFYTLQDTLSEIMKLVGDKRWSLEDWKVNQDYVS